eukprot:2505147-Pyramimonas_sp.AAC.1
MAPFTLDHRGPLLRAWAVWTPPGCVAVPGGGRGGQGDESGGNDAHRHNQSSIPRKICETMGSGGKTTIQNILETIGDPII